MLGGCRLAAGLLGVVVVGIIEGAVAEGNSNLLATLKLKSNLALKMGGEPLRLRGGRSLTECQIGAPSSWAGLNIGPKARRLRRLRSKAIPGKKVVCRWVIDCSRPVADRTLDIADLQNYLSQHIKVQAKTNNLGKTKASAAPRVLLYSEPNHRIIVQAYLPISKQYVKFLIKKYLEARGARDFIWCVATGKCTYQLRYYNFDDVQATAAAPPFEEGDEDEEEEEGEGGAELEGGEGGEVDGGEEEAGEEGEEGDEEGDEGEDEGDEAEGDEGADA